MDAFMDYHEHERMQGGSPQPIESRERIRCPHRIIRRKSACLERINCHTAVPTECHLRKTEASGVARCLRYKAWRIEVIFQS